MVSYSNISKSKYFRKTDQQFNCSLINRKCIVCLINLFKMYLFHQLLKLSVMKPEVHLH